MSGEHKVALLHEADQGDSQQQHAFEQRATSPQRERTTSGSTRGEQATTLSQLAAAPVARTADGLTSSRTESALLAEDLETSMNLITEQQSMLKDVLCQWQSSNLR